MKIERFAHAIANIIACAYAVRFSGSSSVVLLQTLVFINSFLSLNDPNQVAVIGMTSTSR
jgi:hypothetical protein